MKGRRGIWWQLVLGSMACLVVSCAPPPPQPPTVRGLLVQGTAQAEVDRWAEALKLFEQAAETAPDEPVAIYNLAIARFRTGDHEASRDVLAQLEGAPTWLAARAELLRARLAYERGDGEDELAALGETLRLFPDEPAHHHALAELYRRSSASSEELGEALTTAHELWPENAFLASDYALWALGQADEATRKRGLDVLNDLVEASGVTEIAAYFARGRDQLATTDGVPAPFRAVFNLLRATQRFVDDAAEVQGRLEPEPLSDPVRQSVRVAAEPAPAILFEPATLVPELPLGEGEEILQAVIVDHALEVAEGRRREAGIAVLGRRSLFVLDRRGSDWQRLGDVDEASYLLAGDLDDDEQMELVVLTATGIRRWDVDAQQAWTEVAALPTTSPLRRGLLIDFEHDGDLDLLAIGEDGTLWLTVHRGEAGWGTPEMAPLPVRQADLLVSSDLDGDHDQDLVLAAGDELTILRNGRQGHFIVHGRQPLPAAPRRLLPVEIDGDGHMDLAVLHAEGVGLFRGDGHGRLLQGELSAVDAAPLDLASADIDLDGDADFLMATTGDSPGLAMIRNLGDGFEVVRVAASEVYGLLPLDLDGDRDADVFTWSGGGASTLSNQGAEEQGWIALRLRAPGRKVPRDGRGVRLQVAAGDTVQWLEMNRPNVIVGLGRQRPVLVKASWPNGISEYLFDPEAETEHTLTLQMRVEGSCPFLYAFDGEQQRFVTDLLGLAPVGMLAAPGLFVRPDPEEYVRLPDWVAPRGGWMDLVITEELREVLYLDQSEVVAVDAPIEIEVYNGERWLQRPIDGLQLRLLSPLRLPESVLDHRGREVLDIVAAQDDRYLTNHVGPQRYQGAVAPHRLTIAVPPEVAAAEHPAMVLIGWLHWGNTSTNVARSQDPDGAPIFPYLEVATQNGWRRTAVEVGLPAGKTKPIVVDLTDVWDHADGATEPRLIRLTTDFEVYWDRIAVAAMRSVDSMSHDVHRLPPRSAELGWGGFSSWFRPAANGPYLFDYGDRRDYPWRLDENGRDVPLSWLEHQGWYTEYGLVTELLKGADDRLVILGSGDELRLRFDVGSLPAVPEGWRRTYFLHSEGWEKDGDPNVACARTVEPLPRRGAVEDPCAGRIASPSSPRSDSRNRWVAADRLGRRVANLASRSDKVPQR